MIKQSQCDFLAFLPLFKVKTLKSHDSEAGFTGFKAKDELIPKHVDILIVDTLILQENQMTDFAEEKVDTSQKGFKLTTVRTSI